MILNQSADSDNVEVVCSSCQVELEPGQEYRHNEKTFCEECCISVRYTRVRKTHWQYIGSLKEEYIISTT